MKKKSKVISLLSIFLIVFNCLLVYAFEEPVLIKTNKDQYTTSDSVYIVSTISGSDKLCRSIEQGNVKLYIVNNKDDWNNNDVFIDVRDEPSGIPNSKFSNKKIWDDPEIGEYDLIVDCNDDQKYDQANEPIFNTGFNIVPKKGVGRVSKGEIIINDFTWSYDSETSDLENEILQLKLSTENEDIELSDLIVNFIFPTGASGELEVYIDNNKDAKLNSDDALIGSGVFNKSREVITLDYVLKKNVSENILFVYKTGDMVLGEYKIKPESLTGKGAISKSEINFLGFPFESNKMTVTEKKSCLGSLSLEFSSETIEEGSSLVVTAGNMTDCKDKKISLRTTPCYSALVKEIGFCVLEQGKNSCDIIIKSATEKEYYGCMDKNNDRDFFDFGENVMKTININPKQVKEIKQEVKEEIKENKTEEKTILTGEVVNEGASVTKKGFVEEIQNTSSFLILLEVTLLLILFVLILILFKLRGPVQLVNPETDKEELVEDYGEELEDEILEEKKEKIEEEKKKRK